MKVLGITLTTESCCSNIIFMTTMFNQAVHVCIQSGGTCIHLPYFCLSATAPYNTCLVGFNPQSRTASYQRRYKNGTSSALV